jgi:two-component system cell cycle sensor histidine kinase/response regulator CckA
VEARAAPGDLLFWRLRAAADESLARQADRLIAGDAGRRLGEAGIMALLADADGIIHAANPVFIQRAGGGPQRRHRVGSRPLPLGQPQGQFSFAAEGR